jgi:hypothetical protein
MVAQSLLVERCRQEDNLAPDRGCHSPAEKVQTKDEELGLLQISCRHGMLSPSACSISGSHEKNFLENVQVFWRTSESSRGRWPSSS